LQISAQYSVPVAILRAVSDNPAAGISPLDVGSDSSPNKWLENTAEISKQFPAIVKLLVS
jgi:nucleoside phosphorylase